LACSAAILTVQAIAVSQPPPSAKPLLAEIFDEVEHALPEPARLFRFIGIDMREFADVGAGDEGLVSRAWRDRQRSGCSGMSSLECFCSILRKIFSHHGKPAFLS
jgi:hypothetical protein